MNDKISTITDQSALIDLTSSEKAKAWANEVIESGFLPTSIDTPEQVITIVQHGQELGLSPMISLQNIHVIAGKPVISSSMIGALLKRHGIEWIIPEDFAKIDDGANQRTTYTFFWKSKVTGRVMEASHSVTMLQMALAGYTEKQNWQK